MIHTIYIYYLHCKNSNCYLTEKKITIILFFPRNLSTLVIRIKINPVSVKSHRYWNHSNKMAQYKIYIWFHSNISITNTELTATQ